MIAREGLIPVGGSALAAAAVAHYMEPSWSLPLWVLAGCLLYLFREPAPDIPNQPLAVLSPGEGDVVEVVESRDPWLERQAVRVRIALGSLGVGVLRSPVEGKVMDYWTSAQPFNEPGRLRETGFSPNCYSAWVKTDEGDDVVLAVSSLRPISRFKLYVAPGERIGIGQRMGFIYFGNVVDVYMPVGTRREASAGDAVRAGTSVLGALARAARGARNAAEAG